MAASGYRSGTGVLAILEENSGFAVKEAGFEASKVQVNLWNLTTNFQNAAIENQAAMTADLGKHEAGIGVAFEESTFSFDTYAYGLLTAAGDGVTPTVTASFLANLLGACLGGVPTAVAGDTVDALATPTTTSVQQTTAGNLAAKKFLCHTTGGLTYVRPILSYATDTATLALALPAAPTAGDVLQGQISIVMSEDASAHVLQGEILKRNTTDAAKAGQMYEFFGSVGTFSLPEVNVTEPQTISFEMRCAKFTRYANKARVAPTSKRPSCTAGGEYLLAKYGNTAGLALKFLSFGCTLGRDYTGDPRANDAIGIGGWILTGQDTVITCVVHDDESMPTGFSAANYPAAFAAGGDENRWHIQVTFGNKVAGKILVFYFPCLQLEREPEDIDVNGLQAWKLTFSLVANVNNDNKIWAALV